MSNGKNQISKFTIDYYKLKIDRVGFKTVWREYSSMLISNGIEYFENNVVSFDDIGRLYEIGLAHENKSNKKDLGKYYTPKDVCMLMSCMLLEDGRLHSLADTGCGCGNLIIETLKQIKKRSEEEFKEVICNLYLYDSDEIALNVCVSRIIALFGLEQNITINKIKGDFLSKKVFLPKGIAVIANPPYSQIKYLEFNWNKLPCLEQSKDLYIGFLEKILNSANKIVIVSPQSYIVGSKFSKIREKLYKDFSGEIYSFDNVPGTLFDGRKEGIFNTNTANGVRAAIGNFTRREITGFRLTHLIRFKAIQRMKVINLNYLKSQLGDNIQNLKKPLKCFREYENFVYSIINNENYPFEDLLSETRTQYPLYVNSSARYFIVSSANPLDRNGVFTIYAKDEDSYYIAYALLNSSYCYLWWRMMDGGILLPKSILRSIPVSQTLSINIKIREYCDKMIKMEKKYFVYKMNSGVLQQSIKFPEDIRNNLNKLLFKNMDFSLIHNNLEEC